ncbi:pyridoxamine 5'-phosphate oxidase [Parapedobacter lycopersici]|uniref:pyridoxamine 5'-phosphate oxidase n=1 Tax=Parapedobacter lycopersici TaxID=1864939 RepID=UPI00214D5975|nr:pyridoxamine 5'-phosphate oxidase [Parapedobacter lycopersici]
MNLEQKDIAGMRMAYEMGQLNEGDLAEDPLVQFQQWFNEAVDKGVMEPNAMTLSTVSASGKPSSRIVLLKQVDRLGLGFYTNYTSRKGTELAATPHAALLFFWPELQRQVRVEGKVEKLPAEAADAYFRSRPKGSRLGALVSPQSREIANREELDGQLHVLEENYRDTDDIPRPEHWGGYLLLPEQIEFWQGRNNRLHDRLVYKKENEVWRIARLAP